MTSGLSETETPDEIICIIGSLGFEITQKSKWVMKNELKNILMELKIILVEVHLDTQL